MANTHSQHLNQVVELLRSALNGSCNELFAEAKGSTGRGDLGDRQRSSGASGQAAPQGRWIEMAKHNDLPDNTRTVTGGWGGPVPDISDWKDDELSSASAAMFLDPSFPCGESFSKGRKRSL